MHVQCQRTCSRNRGVYPSPAGQRRGEVGERGALQQSRIKFREGCGTPRYESCTASTMSEYHEPYEELDAHTRDLHRAMTSLKEEIEAVDWYTQRVARCADPDLRRILEHNRDEEIEHACMTLEWLRRTMPSWADALKTYLFVDGDILTAEAREQAGKASNGAPGRAVDVGVGVGVGSLKESKR